jgi:large subunit ribosomal protein L10
VYIGDNQLEALAALKSKNELIGEVIGLLQSPIQRVISGLENRKEDTGAAA